MRRAREKVAAEIAPVLRELIARAEDALEQDERNARSLRNKVGLDTHDRQHRSLRSWTHAQATNRWVTLYRRRCLPWCSRARWKSSNEHCKSCKQNGRGFWRRSTCSKGTDAFLHQQETPGGVGRSLCVFLAPIRER